jgi:hypothetical protein
MRRLPIRKIEKDFVYVTPAPTFGRIVALHDRVMGGVKVLGSVPVRGLVAATDMAASAANSQVDPACPYLETFLAPARARLDCADAVEVGAGFTHPIL